MDLLFVEIQNTCLQVSSHVCMLALSDSDYVISTMQYISYILL